LYLEFHSPGIGLPLLVAAIAALLYFAPLFLEGLAANWEIIIFVLGIVLLALEIFVIPGFGFAGIGGIVCVVTGLTLSLVGNIGFDFSGLNISDFLMKLFIVIIAVTAAIPLSIWLSRKLFEGRTFGHRLALNEVQNASEGYTVSDAETASLIGRTGIAVTLMRPSGKVEIDGDTYDALSSVSYVEKGTQVKVVGYENGTLVVELA
ncbi:MAG: nodulation protein NfeD, partial [Bacteroidales bacterium]|nr:nodulation protein NfeD [Bacteroidales bacterium]